MTAKTDKGEIIVARCPKCLMFKIKGKEGYHVMNSMYFTGAVPYKICKECTYVAKLLEEKKRDESAGVRM